MKVLTLSVQVSKDPIYYTRNTIEELQITFDFLCEVNF